MENMRTKKIIIFDFDGVIVQSFPVCFSVTRMYDPEITEEEYKLMFTGNIYDALEARGKRVKRDPDPTFDFFREYMKKIVTLKPVEGTQAVLEKIKALGLQAFITSSTDSQPIKDYLAMNSLDHYFSKIYGGDVEKSKVKKFQMILEDSGTKPDEAIFVTDTLGDLIEADKVGIECIAVSYGFHDKDLLKKSPGKVLIIDSMSELLNLI